MPDEPVIDIKSLFESFSKKAYLDLLLPKDDAFDAASVLRDSSPEELQRATSRRHLFFDEKTKLQIVLRTSQTKDTLQTLLSHLELTVAAHATNSEPTGPGNAASASGKHDITSGKCQATENVTVISVGDSTYAVWKPTLHLIRPKARLQRPAVYFTANLALKTETQSSNEPQKKTYLPSYEPLPANVLEPLQYDPALGESGRQIYLSETRVTKVSPATPQLEHLSRPLRGATKRAFPALPIIFTRVTYSAVPGAVIASLRLETSRLIAGEVTLQDISIAVPGFETKALHEVAWPQTTRAGDETVLLYRLSRHRENAKLESREIETATVSLKATATFEQGSQVNIESEWQSAVDVSSKEVTPPRKWSRLPNAPSNPQVQPTSHASSIVASDGTSRRSTKEGEVVFTFTAPPTVDLQGQLDLRVQCVNKSNTSRQFTLVAAQPTADEGTHASQLESTRQPDALILTPAVRLGPIPTGACFEATLKYRAVARGLLDLGSVRIIDVETKQTVDIADLPDVVCLQRAASAAMHTT